MGMDRQHVGSGFLVSLEGLDGVGKTTQIERLVSWLARSQTEVLTVREPGGTPLGEALRQVVLHQIEAKSGLAEYMVFAAARAELMETVVIPALSRGGVVLMDRFVDSSVAYQGFGHGLNIDTILDINRVVVAGRLPDLTIWLRGEPFPTVEADRVEQRDHEYFRRVEAGYAWLSEREPERWLVLDSRQNPDIIFDTLKTRIIHMLDREGGGL